MTAEPLDDQLSQSQIEFPDTESMTEKGTLFRFTNRDDIRSLNFEIIIILIQKSENRNQQRTSLTNNWI